MPLNWGFVRTGLIFVHNAYIMYLKEYMIKYTKGGAL